MRHHRAAERKSQSGVDLNVTPLIDVLLVLLVIFMATVQLKDQGIDANLPAETRSPDIVALPAQIMLEYTADRRLSVNHQDIALPDLERRLREIYAPRNDKTIFIAGAASLPYGAIVEVMDAAKGAGVQRLGIITEGMRRSASRQD
jgi:biopolymer transport protein TolR